MSAGELELQARPSDALAERKAAWEWYLQLKPVQAGTVQVWVWVMTGSFYSAALDPTQARDLAVESALNDWMIDQEGRPLSWVEETLRHGHLMQLCGTEDDVLAFIKARLPEREFWRLCDDLVRRKAA